MDEKEKEDEMNTKPSEYALLMTSNQEDAVLLDAWIDERIAEKEVQAAELPEEIASVRQDNARLARASGGYDAEITAGEIRILSKRYVKNPDDIPYVAVLGKWDDDTWLVAPFSKYSFPATPGEMATGISVSGLRVIQSWNTRTVHGKLLARSYSFGKLDDAVRRDALALFRHEMAGTELPPEFASLRGSPVLCDIDPRREYIAESISQLGPLFTAVAMYESMCAAREASQVDAWRKSINRLRHDRESQTVDSSFAGLLAAGTERPEAMTFRFDGFEIDCQYSPEAGECVMTAYEGDGKSTVCDGYAVASPDGELLGTFQNGVVHVNESARDGFLLVRPDGDVVESIPDGE